MHAAFESSIATGMLVLLFLFLLIFGALAAFVFWVWMLVDCARLPDDPVRPERRVLWTLVIVFTSFIGAAVYYLAVKRPADAVRRDGRSGDRMDRFPRAHP